MSIWVEDADVIQMETKKVLDLVCKNDSVTNALGENILGIAGIKGLGKTYLLKVKRKLSEDKSIKCIPFNRMCDTIDDSIAINQTLMSYLKSFEIWVKLWKLSIGIAILSDKDNRSIKERVKKRTAKNETFQELLSIDNSDCYPSVIMNEMLMKDKSEFVCILNEIETVLHELSSFQYPINVFIDKIDQGFSDFTKVFKKKDMNLPRNASIWQFAQFSLANASYSIYTNCNRHIKVYYTIRQEALLDSHLINPHMSRNINAFIVSLKYTKDDFQKMFERYIKCEDRDYLIMPEKQMDDPEMAFLGTKSITISGRNERVFDYIYRHTLKRPCDLQTICNELSGTSKKNQIDFLDSVHKSSSRIFDSYMAELSDFLACTTTELEEVIRSVSGNVINTNLMRLICALHYSKNNPSYSCNQDCKSCNSLQPFSILYNIGLIGINNNGIQEFADVGNSLLQHNQHNLPASDYYYLHPCLSRKIESIRTRSGFRFDWCPYVECGHRNHTAFQKRDMDNYCLQLGKTFRSEQVFVSSTCDNEDVKNARKTIRETLNHKYLAPIMSEHSDFDIINANNVHSHDLCIDELLKCGSMIFVISERYGGIYKGIKYIDLRDSIKRDSKGKIKEPSISLMEFYAAVKNGLKYYVFLSKELHERIINNKTITESDRVDERVVTQFNFINHLKGIQGVVGNWISMYTDEEDLKRRVINLRFE